MNKEGYFLYGEVDHNWSWAIYQMAEQHGPEVGRLLMGTA